MERFEGASASLRGEAAHHLGRVLRAEPGQVYELSDGESLWLGRVESVRKDAVEFALVEQLPVQKPKLCVTLALSIVKFDRFEWILEKTTELGVSRIVPVEAERSEILRGGVVRDPDVHARVCAAAAACSTASPPRNNLRRSKKRPPAGGLFFALHQDDVVLLLRVAGFHLHRDRATDELRQHVERGRLLLEEEVDHRLRGKDAELLGRVGARLAQDLAQDLVAHGRRGLHLAAAAAGRAGLAQHVGYNFLTPC